MDAARIGAADSAAAPSVSAHGADSRRLLEIKGVEISRCQMISNMRQWHDVFFREVLT